VQEGKPDRIADLLEEAAVEIERLRAGLEKIIEEDDSMWRRPTYLANEALGPPGAGEKPAAKEECAHDFRNSENSPGPWCGKCGKAASPPATPGARDSAEASAARTEEAEAWIARMEEMEEKHDAALTAARAEADELRDCEDSLNEDACGACLACRDVSFADMLRQRVEAQAHAARLEGALGEIAKVAERLESNARDDQAALAWCEASPGVDDQIYGRMERSLEIAAELRAALAVPNVRGGEER
jgi:hypothetical protein